MVERVDASEGSGLRLFLNTLAYLYHQQWISGYIITESLSAIYPRDRSSQ